MVCLGPGASYVAVQIETRPLVGRPLCMLNEVSEQAVTIVLALVDTGDELYPSSVVSPRLRVIGCKLNQVFQMD